MKVSQEILKNELVAVEELKLINYDIAVGMKPDMTKHGWYKDDWPIIFEKIMHTDNLFA